MIEQDKVKVGDKVHYKPDHYTIDEAENGIVKEVPMVVYDAVRVVYDCDDNWDEYDKYPSAMTRCADLHFGWVDEQ